MKGAISYFVRMTTHNGKIIYHVVKEEVICVTPDVREADAEARRLKAKCRKEQK